MNIVSKNYCKKSVPLNERLLKHFHLFLPLRLTLEISSEQLRFERGEMSRSNREARPEGKVRTLKKTSQMVDIQKKWFAARTRDKQEFAIRERLQRLRVEHGVDLEYYLPTRTVFRQLKYRRKRVEVPVIRNLIFVRATRQVAVDLSNKEGVALFYMKDLSTHGMLVVPDKQMDDFRFMMDLSPDGVSFDNASLTMGSRVKVVKGELSGVEGEVGTVSNRTYVVIRIRGVLTASVKLPRSYLKIIG